MRATVARACALVAATSALALGACTPRPAITSSAPRPPKPVASANDDLRTVLGPMLERPRDGRGGVDEQPQGVEPDDLSSEDGHLPDATVEAPPPPPPEEKAERGELTKGGESARDDDDERRPAPRAATATALGGKLNADQVNAVIDANFDRLSACSDGEVVVSVRATVSTEGRVIEASAIRSTPDDPRIRDCIATTFRTLEFPRVASEWPTRLSFDLRVGGS